MHPVPPTPVSLGFTAVCTGTHLPRPHCALAQRVGGVGEIPQTSGVGEERDDGVELAVSMVQGEGQAGPRDQVGSVSLMSGRY